jgi:diguanylate cyclase (GGDEF)-like protein
MLYEKPLSPVKNKNAQLKDILLATASSDPKKFVRMYLKEKNARIEAERLAETDEITKFLLNKRGWRHVMKKEGYHLARHGEQFAMLFIDLDTLKKVNDTFGHHMGTKYIKLFAEVLDKTLRPEDTTSHPQGDEFFAMMPRIKKEEAEEYRDKIVENFQVKLESLDKDDDFYLVFHTFPTIGPSVGIAHKIWTYDERKEIMEGSREESIKKVYSAMNDVLKLADKDLYVVKYARKQKAKANLGRLARVKVFTQTFKFFNYSFR